MTEPAAPPAKPPRTWRPMVGWTLGILAVLGLAWFVGAVVVPVWRAQQTLDEFEVLEVVQCGPRFAARYHAGRICPLLRFATRQPDMDYRDSDFSILSRGQEGAVRALRMYLVLPPKMAPRRAEAAYVLSRCGQHGVKTLQDLLGDKDSKVRAIALWGLGEIGYYASDSIPVIEPLFRDKDELVRATAAQALGDIRSEQQAVRAAVEAQNKLRGEEARQ